MFHRFLLGLSLVSAFSIPAIALGQQRPPRPKPEVQPISLDGTVYAVARGQIQMKTTDSKPYQVYVQQGAQIRLLGSATPDFLKPGMAVEFVGDLDKTGKTNKEVDQLTIYTVTERSSGLFPETAATPKPTLTKGKGPAAAVPAGPDPGIAADPATKKRHGKQDDAGGNDLFGGGAGGGAAPGAGKTQAPKITLPAVCTVRGQIKSVHGNKIMLTAGRGKMVTADVADNAQIDVNMADYAFAKTGDGISIKGMGMKGQPIASAQAITINCANPLSGNKKPARKTASPKADKPAAKSAKTAEKDADAPEAKDAK